MDSVVICGAGPVGLMLAAELRLQGVEVTMLERLTAISEVVKAGSVGGQSVLSFDQRGLVAPMLEGQAKGIKDQRGTGHVSAEGMMLKGHFAGSWLIDHTLTPLGHGGIPIAQADLERVLEKRAKDLGVRLVRGVEVAAISQDATRVTVTLTNGERVHATWLVGCDGGRSFVRKQMKVTFDGTDPTITGRQAIVDLEGGDKLPGGWTRHAGGMLTSHPSGGMVFVPFHRVMTVEFDGPPKDRYSEVTAEEIEASIFRVCGIPVHVTKLHSATRWTDTARVASSYRDGRFFLAGDAAHIHSPFGGQGLNLGLQDAMNLAWKLGAVMRGAPESLLDTYTAERKPIAERVCENTRAQLALMRPGREVTALRDVFNDMMKTPAANVKLAARMSGTDVRYSARNDHPLAGTMVRDRVLDDGRRLYGVLRSGHGAIVDFSGRIDNACRATRNDGETVQAMVIRPDGMIAWATDDQSFPVQDVFADWPA